mmetsp:Transcript_21605/g.50440  ORF Transcript_21605/g.50440 Transcript_21605/m.50440 type:complete len:1099 (-) Transcript_21605:81-3377(-)
MGYGVEPGKKSSRRSPTRQSAIRGCSLEAPQDGPNPFAAENAKWLRSQRRASSAPRRSPESEAKVRRRSASAIKQRIRQQHLEQAILQGLERLGKRDTLELGSRQLQEVLINLEPPQLVWFLRKVFDDKKPLQGVVARREQLLLLTNVVQQFPDVVISSGALQDRVFPTLLGALRMNDTQDTVARVCSEIFVVLCADEDVDKFLTVCPIIVKAFLDPMVLGAGWDTLRKQRCLSVLGSIVPVLLTKAVLIESEPRVQATLEGIAALLSHCMAANQSLHEGVLQCLVHLAAHQGTCLATHAHQIAETCYMHLLETPSNVPVYAQPSSAPGESGRAESPPRRCVLTRELALVCCICLKHVAERVVAVVPQQIREALVKMRPSVEAGLARDNLNLQRLTRGNEPLRAAIAHAWQAWHEISDQPSGPSRPVVLGARSGPWQYDEVYSRQRQLREMAQPLLQNLVPDNRPGSRPSKQQRAASAGASRIPRPPPLPLQAVQAQAQAPAAPPSCPTGPGAAEDVAKKQPKPMGMRKTRSSGGRPRVEAAAAAAPPPATPASLAMQPDDVAQTPAPPSPSPPPAEAVAPAQPRASQRGCRQFHTESSSSDEEEEEAAPLAIERAVSDQWDAQAPPARDASPLHQLQLEDDIVAVAAAPVKARRRREEGAAEQGMRLESAPIRSSTKQSLRPQDSARYSRRSTTGELELESPAEAPLATWEVQQQGSEAEDELHPSGPAGGGHAAVSHLRQGQGHRSSLQRRLTAPPNLLVADGPPARCGASAPSAPPLAAFADPKRCNEEVAVTHSGPMGVSDQRIMHGSGPLPPPATASAHGKHPHRSGAGPLPAAPSRREAPAQPQPAPAVEEVTARGPPPPVALSGGHTTLRVRTVQLDEEPAKAPADYPEPDSESYCGSESEMHAYRSVKEKPNLQLERPRAVPQRPSAAQPQDVVAPCGDSPEDIPEPLITWTVPPDGDAPGLGAALQCLAGCSVQEAFHVVFAVGNEKTLQAILARVDPESTWPLLPQDEGKHLAHLLARLTCKEPLGEPAVVACEWLHALIQWPGGSQALRLEDKECLRPALFAMSGSPGRARTLSAALYHMLFQETKN